MSHPSQYLIHKKDHDDINEESEYRYNFDSMWSEHSHTEKDYDDERRQNYDEIEE